MRVGVDGSAGGQETEPAWGATRRPPADVRLHRVNAFTSSVYGVDGGPDGSGAPRETLGKEER
jgi:hypothetical protein